MPEDSVVQNSGIPETSESEEMYLLTVARAAESGHEGPLPVTTLAARLGVSPASANEMIHRLTGRRLATYEPYRGVGLTDRGREIAHRVLRVRRLWAAFLADELGLSPAEADTIACRLEHVTPIDVADQLARFLGDPAVGPLGDPIDPGSPSVPVSDVAAGSTVHVVEVPTESTLATFLLPHGIHPGATMVVEATGTRGVLVTAEGPVHLGPDLAAQILVVEAGP